MPVPGWLLPVTLHARMSAAAVTSLSRIEGSIDRCASVTDHSTQVSLVAL